MLLNPSRVRVSAKCPFRRHRLFLFVGIAVNAAFVWTRIRELMMHEPFHSIPLMSSLQPAVRCAFLYCEYYV